MFLYAWYDESDINYDVNKIIIHKIIRIYCLINFNPFSPTLGKPISKPEDRFSLVYRGYVTVIFHNEFARIKPSKDQKVCFTCAYIE